MPIEPVTVPGWAKILAPGVTPAAPAAVRSSPRASGVSAAVVVGEGTIEA